MEGLCKRLLLCSVCGALLCASCQNVSDRFMLSQEYGNPPIFPFLPVDLGTPMV
jgi:hypothetical protein